MRKPYILTDAVFSFDRVYRYRLERWWQSGNRKGLRCANFIGLNCSTATDTEDDPTIRRCVGFAQDWGYDGYVMTNIFAYRSTDTKGLLAVDDPVGSWNNDAIIQGAWEADIVIAAWGVHGTLHGRGEAVLRMLIDNGIKVHCLGVTKAGHPKHPLYLPKTAKPRLYRGLDHEVGKAD